VAGEEEGLDVSHISLEVIEHRLEDSVEEVAKKK
jgi:hypothetical protein